MASAYLEQNHPAPGQIPSRMGAAPKTLSDAELQDAAFQNSLLPGHRGKDDLNFLLLTAAQELSSTFTPKMEALSHGHPSPAPPPGLLSYLALLTSSPSPYSLPWKTGAPSFSWALGYLLPSSQDSHVLLSPLPSTMSILFCLLILIEIDSGFSQSKCMYPPLTPLPLPASWLPFPSQPFSKNASQPTFSTSLLFVDLSPTSPPTPSPLKSHPKFLRTSPLLLNPMDTWAHFLLSFQQHLSLVVGPFFLPV